MPVIHVADVDLQAREAQLVSGQGEDLSGAISGSKCLLVLPAQRERKNRCTEIAPKLGVVAQFFPRGNRVFV